MEILSRQWMQLPQIQSLSSCLFSLCRYIELINGLRALLISDFSGTDEKACSENGEDNQEREDGDEEEESEEEGDSGEGSEEDEEENEEEEQDSDFEELDEENAAKKKRGCSEKQVSDSLIVVMTNVMYNIQISSRLLFKGLVEDSEHQRV